MMHHDSHCQPTVPDRPHADRHAHRRADPATDSPAAAAPPLASLDLLDPLTHQQWKTVRQRVDLTDREFQILRCIVCGLSDAQITAALAISRSTLRTHMAAVFRTCGRRSRVGVVIKTLEPFVRWWQ